MSADEKTGWANTSYSPRPIWDWCKWIERWTLICHVSSGSWIREPILGTARKETCCWYVRGVIFFSVVCLCRFTCSFIRLDRWSRLCDGIFFITKSFTAYLNSVSRDVASMIGAKSIRMLSFVGLIASLCASSNPSTSSTTWCRWRMRVVSIGRKVVCKESGVLTVYFAPAPLLGHTLFFK